MSSTTGTTIPTRTLFVTVGTTRFTALTNVMTDPLVLQHMVAHGITHLILQYGQGPRPDVSAEHAPLHVECYDFKPSLRDDLLRADVLVCHAGAGTLTEALRLLSPDKAIVTVINSQLMDNHQTELAYALQRRGWVYVLDAPEAWLDEETQGRRVWQHIAAALEGTASPNNAGASPASPPGDPYDVPRILYNVLGQEYIVKE